MELVDLKNGFFLKKNIKKKSLDKIKPNPNSLLHQTRIRSNPIRINPTPEIRKNANPNTLRAGSVSKSQIRNPKKLDPCAPLILRAHHALNSSIFTIMFKTKCLPKI